MRMRRRMMRLLPARVVPAAVAVLAGLAAVPARPAAAEVVAVPLARLLSALPPH